MNLEQKEKENRIESHCIWSEYCYKLPFCIWEEKRDCDGWSRSVRLYRGMMHEVLFDAVEEATKGRTTQVLCATDACWVHGINNAHITIIFMVTK